MKCFVLTYDPSSDPRDQAFDGEASGFQVLESETVNNLGRDGVEVVLFYSESQEALRSANQRYFDPGVSHRLRENPALLRPRHELLQRRLNELLASPSPND